MNFFKRVFSTKRQIWQGSDTVRLEEYKNKLRENNIWFSAFKVNQAVPKCSGDCGTCSSGCDLPKDASVYEKTKARQDMILNMVADGSKKDIYAIYVVESDLNRARSMLFEK